VSGICGIIRFDNKKIKKEEIHKMLDVIQNCGNDTEEIWINENVGFGHKMLWTTPESLHEKQPLVSEDDKFILIADARIDNRKELLEQLNIKEMDDKVITDADLIMNSYFKWKENCGQYLIGDFAFVIWDKKKESCFFIRDHMGIKPLYYFCSDTLFVFASEISALFTINEISKSIDKEAIDKYHELIALECDKTFFCDIFRIKPGHILILQQKKLKYKRYWYPEKISVNYSMSLEEAKSGFKQVLSQAILSRMRRLPGPIGCELSGGLDSSSVVVLTNELTTDQILTFSATFEGLECDEQDFIDSVLDKTSIKGFFAKFNKEDYRDKYSFMHYYEYSIDWVGRSIFSFFFDVMKKAKEQNVKVMLTGFGADEIFPDRSFMLSSLLSHGYFKSVYRELKGQSKPLRYFLLYGLLPLLPTKIIKFLELIYPHMIFKRILSTYDQFDYMCHSLETVKHKPFTELFNLKTILSNDVDELYTLSMYRFSGRFGLEYRHPFLDKRVIEYILSVPSYYKFSNMKTKSLLRETFKELLPEIVYTKLKDNDFSELTKYTIENYIEVKKEKKQDNWVQLELKYWELKNKG